MKQKTIKAWAVVDNKGYLMHEVEFLHINDNTQKKTNLGHLLSVYTLKKGATEENKDRPAIFEHKIVRVEIKILKTHT